MEYLSNLVCSFKVRKRGISIEDFYLYQSEQKMEIYWRKLLNLNLKLAGFVVFLHRKNSNRFIGNKKFITISNAANTGWCHLRILHNRTEESVIFQKAPSDCDNSPAIYLDNNFQLQLPGTATAKKKLGL